MADARLAISQGRDHSDPRQRFEDAERVTRGERMSFNPWHCLVPHVPVGGMNRARREIYRAMAEFRRSR